MSSRRGHFKDRILEGIAKAIKEVHAFSCSADGEIVTVTNDDRPLQKLVERLDHAFLHGLKNVTRGYWGVAKLFAHRGIIDEITKLDRLTTDLGRSRAWLYKSLNDTSLESYLRCFQENPSTMRKYYVETGMLRDKQRVMVLQTLIAGLDYVTFDLEINIAYFDLVSYIPRSASVSEPEDDTTTPSNDSVPTTPGTPATIPDSVSSIASSEPFSPMDESPQSDIRIPNIVIKNRSDIEKRHSFPQHYSEIDENVPPLVETPPPEDKGMGKVPGDKFFNRSFSAGKIIEGKPTRPSSLGVPFRNERSLSSDASFKSVEEGFEGSDLEVIRVKTKKTKKGHKKKKRGDRTSLDGDKLSRNGSSGTLSSMCDDIETPSPRLETQAGDSISKSSSYSSLHSFSDRASWNEAAILGKSDADSLSGISFEVKTDNQQDKHTPNEQCDEMDGMTDLKKLIKDMNEKTTNLRLEIGQTKDTNDSPQLSHTKDDSDFEPRSFDSDSALPNSSNLAKFQPEIIRPDVKPDLAPASRASLNFDETVTMTLGTTQASSQGDPPPSQALPDLIQKKDSQSDLDTSLTTVPSETVTSFASLFAKPASPTSMSPEDPLPLPSPSSSSCSASDISANPSEEGLNETSGSSGKGVRSSSDASSSFKESMEADEGTSDVAKETATMAALDVGSESHEAEIEVDNNLKLYLMLEIFKKEHEEFKKLIRMSTGHMEGDLQPAFILLTDQMLYILRRGDKQGHYSTQQRLPYTTLDYISVGLNYQTIQVVCTNRRRQYWLTTGDESLTRFFLSSLKHIMEESQLTKESISILTDATAQMIMLRKWAAQESKTEMQNIKLHLYSLVHWEDLTDLSMTPDLQLYEPQVTRKGYLHYKVPGNFLKGNSWKKAWFALRNEMFCRFLQRKDQQPDLSVQLRTPYFGGCRRVRNGDRPHSFELILSDGASLELACDKEEQVSDWLQAICQVVAQAQVAATSPTHTPSPCQPCCSVITSHKLLICHEDCQTNFYRLLAGVDITDISGLTHDPQDGTYVIVEFQSECAQNPWVFYFNSVQEKAKFESTLNSAWKEQLQVDLPVTPIDDDRVHKRCCECSALIQSSWQRSDSLMRGRIGGSIW
ncbi:pleckstrin homology domain-containing family M member 2-like [Patiria miniata]|uniref:Uncharacterized protein n=1 Tax=Patiria miniata TaxID=46514 RepID=A0A914BNH0_PATMI|nr:pleckstrin homology domain-containing family M member 2-like [Patiria miniata]